METPTNIHNADSMNYRKMINRFIEEQLYSQSSNSSKYKQADIIRLGTYTSSMRFHLNFMKSQPEQDLPETDPKEYLLEANPEVFLVENEMVNHVVKLFVLARDEMDHSQTARDSSGIQEHDLKRQEDYITRIETYVRDYIQETSPLDLPESSPRRRVQGAGKTGITGPGK